MKQTFIVDTQEDVFEFERLLRSIISLMHPDWKTFILEWADDLSYETYIDCPYCEERITKEDYFCKWCGESINATNQYLHKGTSDVD